ncbi:hypothetical protein SAMN05421753_104204 [Planctomicrobium piriforme]|uniref:Uncharacterized protein n=1 Tax=Planctomicrobium piriforme TaxID=1576369 RepID=A0A1I3EG24_9PLAN|nr:hypothetical protein SAMN05421753_104204 [Planctomicrobium piriforme]
MTYNNQNGIWLPKPKPEPYRAPTQTAEYHVAHAACPQCVGTRHERTCMGCIGDEDRNSSKCLDCGWIGIVHDCVPVKTVGETE